MRQRRRETDAKRERKRPKRKGGKKRGGGVKLPSLFLHPPFVMLLPPNPYSPLSSSILLLQQTSREHIGLTDTQPETYKKLKNPQAHTHKKKIPKFASCCHSRCGLGRERRGGEGGWGVKGGGGVEGRGGDGVGGGIKHKGWGSDLAGTCVNILINRDALFPQITGPRVYPPQNKKEKKLCSLQIFSSSFFLSFLPKAITIQSQLHNSPAGRTWVIPRTLGLMLTVNLFTRLSSVLSSSSVYLCQILLGQ